MDNATLKAPYRGAGVVFAPDPTPYDGIPLFAPPSSNYEQAQAGPAPTPTMTLADRIVKLEIELAALQKDLSGLTTSFCTTMQSLRDILTTKVGVNLDA